MIFQVTKLDKITYNPRHKDSVKLVSPTTQTPDSTTSHLVLSPVDFSHAGNYKCEAVFSGESTFSEPATFFVRGFKVHPQVRLWMLKFNKFQF